MGQRKNPHNANVQPVAAVDIDFKQTADRDSVATFCSSSFLELVMNCCICNGGGGGYGWQNRCETCKGRGYIKVRSNYDIERLIQLSRQLANDPTNVRLQMEAKELSEKLD